MNTRALLCSMILLTWPALGAAGEPAQTPQAAEAPARNEALAAYERAPLLGADAGAEEQSQSEASEESPWAAVARIAAGLAVFVLIAWVGASVFKRAFPRGRNLFSSPAAEVLGRTYLDSRRYLALVRVGARVLVLGVSPERISPVCEVQDAEEVTEILSTARPATEAGRSTFRRLLDAAVAGHKEQDAASAAGGEATRLSREVDAIHDRLRGMRAAE